MTVVDRIQSLTSTYPSTIRTIAGVESCAQQRSRRLDHSDDSLVDLTLLIERAPTNNERRRGHFGKPFFDETDVESSITIAEYMEGREQVPETPLCTCDCGRPSEGFYGDGLAKYCRDLAWAKAQR